MVKDGKVDKEKVIDSTIVHVTGSDTTQLPMKDKILPFTSKLGTDQYAEVLSPEFGRITVSEPVSSTYPSPMHYVEAMKIASLSSMPLGGMGQTPASPCDDARATLSSLALQPHASIIKSVANSCVVTGKDWFKPETARGRFWFYLWIGLWSKFVQNAKYANALYATGGKLLIFYDSDAVYGQGPDGAGLNAAGFLMMLLRGIIGAGWGTQRNAANNPGFFFDKWVLPAINAVYKTDGTFQI
jgi:hypothetical protein